MYTFRHVAFLMYFEVLGAGYGTLGYWQNLSLSLCWISSLELFRYISHYLCKQSDVSEETLSPFWGMGIQTTQHFLENFIPRVDICALLGTYAA